MTRSRTRLTPVAQRLRKAENNPEARLWMALRGRRLNGHKFRRQFPIGDYVADFACVELRLVVELDGSQHVDNAADAIRDDYMNNAGWSVARFPSVHMLSAPEGVIETLIAICEGKVSEAVMDHDLVFRLAKDPSSGASRHLLPSSGEKWNKDDPAFMRKALLEGLSQMGQTWPNPPVGCIIVRDGKLVGKGATGDGGRPHAEEVALENAGERAQGATAYVTLEPCGARSNGAPSCSEKLIAAGINRVVYACADPSPFASHKGPERMIAAGLTVESGLMAAEAEILIHGFVHFLKTGRPLVVEISGGLFDGEFIRDTALSPEDDLHAWGAKGYRYMFVRPGTPAAADLRKAGLSILPPEGEADEKVVE